MSLEHLFSDLEKLTSVEARSKLPKLSFEEFTDYLIIDQYGVSKEDFSKDFELLRQMSALTSVYKNKMYINYLCARGDIDGFKKFLSTLKQDIPFLLNASFNDSKVDVYLFKTVLNWNTGEEGEKLFNLLYSYGCRIKQSHEKSNPFVNNSTEWISPLAPFRVLGLRNRDEFWNTTIGIKMKYRESYDFLDDRP